MTQRASSRRACLVALLLSGSQAWTRPVAAQSGAAPEYQEPLVDIHAFVSQGFIKSTDNEYLAKSKRGSFEFTEVGVNLTRALGVGVQLFTRDLGPIGNYRARFDWFELDYHFFDWLGLRAGRTKLPYGLYNETSDIDAARVPILLPQSVYPTANRDYLLAQTGVELYGYVSLGFMGALDYRLYGGTLYLDLADTASNRQASYEVPYLLGGRAVWTTPLQGLLVGGTVQVLRLDGAYVPTGAEDPALASLDRRGLIPAGYVGPVSFELPAALARVTGVHCGRSVASERVWPQLGGHGHHAACASVRCRDHQRELLLDGLLPYDTLARPGSVLFGALSEREGSPGARCLSTRRRVDSALRPDAKLALEGRESLYARNCSSQHHAERGCQG